MSEINEKLTEEVLENVSGGLDDEDKKRKEEAERSLHGHIVKDALGNVTFTDKTGASVVLSKAQWEALKANYTHTGGNPEAYLKEVSIKEMKEANLIPSNPLGV